MTTRVPMGQQNKRIAFPMRVFLLAIVIVCLSLALNAGYGFFTLSNLREEYLRNQGNEIAKAIDQQVRGRGKRSSPANWMSIFEENFEAYSDSLAFIALLDQSDQILAYQSEVGGQPGADASGFTERDIFIFDWPLTSSWYGRMDVSDKAIGWRLQIGLKTAKSDFIRHQAIIQLAIAGVAIAALLALAYLFLRTFGHFLDLKRREEQQRHLSALGTMAATLSHEIRNPLAAMKGLTQLAQEELPVDHKSQASMKTVVSEAERLERLVDDLLTFAKLPKFQINSFDFMQLVFEVKAMLKTKLEAAGISLEILPETNLLMIDSDMDGLRQVLLNVFLNAIEVTPRGGTIKVRMIREDSRFLILRVDDAGPGLKDKNAEELFQPFTTTKTQGIGLGLAVSRRIVEGLGGSLSLANRPEGGARCTMQLPL